MDTWSVVVWLELLSPNLIRVIWFRLKAIVSGFYERKLQETNLDSTGGIIAVSYAAFAKCASAKKKVLVAL